METAVKHVTIRIDGLEDVKKKCFELSEKIKEVGEIVDSLTSAELTATVVEPED